MPTKYWGANCSRCKLLDLIEYPISAGGPPKVLWLGPKLHWQIQIFLKIYSLRTIPSLFFLSNVFQSLPFNLWYSIWANLGAYFLSPLGMFFCWKRAVKSHSFVLFYFFIWGNIPVSRFTTCCLSSAAILSFYWKVLWFFSKSIYCTLTAFSE